ncbi:MAG: hypothetical protein EBS73_01035 [Betaproteobacteria bacterium]|nr:hypothetical protein [Betaproteobacteria bacterium]HAB47211.1 hypothetical protein [Lautropia sp.]NBS37890.1 hypothetical protein [Betaproteobacteria bacterium]NBT80634.1 hypothetical protein [Betaproteobacteria bacterium]NBY55254.1 hypothetical protein [Betaproteobacteria bacterium]
MKKGSRMIGRLKFLSFFLLSWPCLAQASAFIDLDEQTLRTRAREAASAGVRLQCTQAYGPSLTAHVPALSRTYVLHRGLIWVMDADSGDLVHPSAYTLSQGVIRWRNEAIGFAVRPFRPRHEIHLSTMQEFADGNQLTGPFPCKLERGSLQSLS